MMRFTPSLSLIKISLCLVFFCFVWGTSPSVVDASTVAYSGGGTTYSGFVGDSRTANLTGGLAGNTYTFYWASTSTGTTYSLGTCSTGLGSTCSLTFSAPHTTKGDWFVHAQINPVPLDVSNALTFTISPKLTASSPSSGFVGTSVAISGTGFAAESVTAKFDTFTLGSATPSSGVGGSAGDLSVTAGAPEMPQGSHAVHATGTTSGDVTSAFTFSVSPQIALSSTSGITGATTHVSGNGFAASSAITITLDGSNTATTTTTNSSGTFSATSYTPTGSAGGHDIGAHDSVPNTATALRYVIIDPSITISSNTGTVGSNITLTGTAFKPGVTVTLTWDGSDTATTVTSDSANGAFSGLSFTIPSAVAGAHSIGAHDTDSHSAPSKTYTVTPKITLSASTGIVGSTTLITGSGFAASSTVTVKWDGSASGPTVSSDASGGFSSFGFTIPTSVYGNHTIGATDAGANSASGVTFSVTPSITLNSYSGAPGDSIIVSGTGFDASSMVTVWFNGSATSTTGTSASNGTFSGLTYTTSALQAAGTYPVTAKDEAAHAAPNVNYQVGSAVTDAFITLSATSGNVGDIITISGNNFSLTASNVTLRWDGSNTATTCSLSGGSFSGCSFTLPAATAGTHTVSAKDNAVVGSKTSLNQNYLIEPKITLSSTTASAGTSITVSGSGFAGSSTVTLTWDNANTATTTTSSSTGGFSSLSFTIPANGSHTVGAHDASSHYAVNVTGSFGGGGSLSVDIVDSGGSSVGSPSVAFGSKTFSWSSQTASGTLGASSEKIRLTNTTGTANWTLSLAASSPTALWTSSGNTYDFNGSSANGRLQVDPSAATITPQGGCSSTGLSRGSATYFAQGSQDSVNLVTASGSAQTNCYWDMTGISLNQDIPSNQNTGTYSLSMVLTAT